MDVNGNSLRQLTQGGVTTYASWSPDGQSCSFAAR